MDRFRAPYERQASKQAKAATPAATEWHKPGSAGAGSREPDLEVRAEGSGKVAAAAGSRRIPVEPLGKWRGNWLRNGFGFDGVGNGFQTGEHCCDGNLRIKQLLGGSLSRAESGARVRGKTSP